MSEATQQPMTEAQNQALDEALAARGYRRGDKIERPCSVGQRFRLYADWCESPESVEAVGKEQQREPPFVLRVLSRSKPSDKWIDKVVKQAAKLGRLHVPHLSSPRLCGTTRSDDVFVVEDYYAKTVRLYSQESAQSKKLPAAEALILAEQMLEALAGLHDANMKHGEVRPECIFVDRSQSKERTRSYWLAGASFGWATNWSDGDVRPKGSDLFRPPGCDATEPTFASDLYGLAATLCELTDTDPKLHDDGSQLSRREKIVKSLRDALSSGGQAAVLERIVRQLRAAEQDKKSARDILNTMRQERDAASHLGECLWPSASRGWRGRIVRVTIAIIACGFAYFGLSGAFAALSDQIQQDHAHSRALQIELTEANTQLAACNAENGSLKTKISNPTQTPSEPPNDLAPAHRRAQGIWTKNIKPSDADPFANLIELLGKTYQGEELAAMKLVRGWLVDARDLWHKSRPWGDSDPELARMVATVFASPWDLKVVTAANDRLNDLNSAAEKWKRWAINPDLSFQALKDIAKSPDISPSVRGILEGWLGQFAGKTEWKLRLDSGSSTKDEGTARLLTLTIAKPEGEEKQEVATPVHVWNRWDSHDYNAEETDDNRLLEFGWGPGDAITALLEGENAWGIGALDRWNLTKDTFGGPLAIWYVHYWGGLKPNSETVVTVIWTVEGCPGPPRGVYWPLGKLPVPSAVLQDPSKAIDQFLEPKNSQP